MRTNKTKYYIAIVLYGIVLLFALLGLGNLYGSKVDWIDQHCVFPDMFRENFYDTGRLIPNFNFNLGGGQNQFNFAYYGFLSPVILISYALPFADMTLYVIFASIVLYLLTGVLTFKFLSRHFDANKAFLSALIMLSLPPVNYHFHHHIMFVWYLPFLMTALIGLDQYFEKRRKTLFAISVVCIILTNYFFSVGCLICLFLYAMYRHLDKEGITGKQVMIAFFKSVYMFIIPVLICGFFLLPTAYALFTGERTSIVEVTKRDLFVADLNSVFYESYTMGITGIMLVAVIGNLCSRNKTPGVILVNVVLLLIALFPVVSYVLNGFLYIRGKALIPFVILFLIALNRFLERIKRGETDLRKLFGWTIAFAVICYMIRRGNINVTIEILVSMAVVLCFKGNYKQVLAYTLVLVICLSAYYNIEEEYVSVSEYKSYHLDEAEQIMDSLPDDYCRTGYIFEERNNSNYIYGTNHYSTSMYSSTYHSDYLYFYKNIASNNIRFRNRFFIAECDNELFHTYMGTRYIVSKTDPGLYYTEKDRTDNLILYKNEKAYPVVYVNDNIGSMEELRKLKFPYSLEYIMSCSAVEGDYSSDYKTKIQEHPLEDSEYRFIAEKDFEESYDLGEEFRNKLVYLSFDIDNESDEQYINKDDISICINGIQNKLTARNWQYYNENNTFKYVIPMEDRTTLDVTVLRGPYNIKNVHLYSSDLPDASFDEIPGLKLDKSEDRITCTVDSKEGDWLITTIPFDKGFKVTVNGKKVNPERVNGAFMGVKLSPGKNNIVLAYEAPMYKAGIAVTIFGLMLLMWELIKRRKFALEIYYKYKEIIMYLVFGALTTLVSVVTYFLCTHTVFNPHNPILLQGANVISWIVSVSFAYFTNRKYVFSGKGAFLSEAGKFYASRLSTLALDMILMYVFVSLMHLNDIIVKVTVQFVVIVANYILSKFVVFKK